MKSSPIQELLKNSDLGVCLALALGRYVPPRLGYPLVLRIAKYISHKAHWDLVLGARLNQWLASGQTLSKQGLDIAVERNFCNQALALYDNYRFLAKPEATRSKMVLDSHIRELITRSQRQTPGQGCVLVGIHLSNFDFGMQVASLNGLRALIISLAELPGGYQRQFELRRHIGMELVTASKSSLRLALERLKAGGVVLTGIDRPVSETKYKPRFFNQPAHLPVHHILLALKAGVPVTLAAVIAQEDGNYHFLVSDPIPMQSFPDREKEILWNAEQVLLVAEDFIRQAPQQWAMFHPVWPDLIDTLPIE